MSTDIDLVYLWVDGNDPQWLIKKHQFLDSDITEIELAGRYDSNDELKYSLRSVNKHLPWIRKIFIITDNQIPDFIDVNHPKIEIINHTDIMPANILPTFNSVVIEYFIHKISDLSEHFLYMNDDMFINNDLPPEFFFKDGLPVIRVIQDKLMGVKLSLKKAINKPINNYRLSIENAYKLFKQQNKVFYPIKSHHNVDSYLKSNYQQTISSFDKQLQPLYANRFRSKNDIQRIILQYDLLFRKKAHLQYASREESCRIPVQKPDYMRYINRYQPDVFCLNDTEHATDEDRKRVKPFLEVLFPEKSPFER